MEHPPNLEDDPKTIGFWQLCSNFFRIEAFWFFEAFWFSWDTGVIGDEYSRTGKPAERVADSPARELPVGLYSSSRGRNSSS